MQYLERKHGFERVRIGTSAVGYTGERFWTWFKTFQRERARPGEGVQPERRKRRKVMIGREVLRRVEAGESFAEIAREVEAPLDELVTYWAIATDPAASAEQLRELGASKELFDDLERKHKQRMREIKKASKK